MSYGTKWGPDGPPPEAYSRVTDAERFRPLHAAMREIIYRLQNDFDVALTEGYGLDEELERRLTLDAPSVRLTPSDSGAAPITVVFTNFPGLHLRFGHWLIEPFPDCGCDACDESAEGEIENLTDMVDDVTAGRFREWVRIPMLSSAAWKGREKWADQTRLHERNTGTWSGGESRIDRREARAITGGRRRMDFRWKPWARRQAGA
ncbi:MAG: DUF6226 family protein [Chloroflexota bacterium]|nr:DUF6226 family protein [Chloroflexota bacterium]MDE2941597.1 DUF6226 family protein [Chloroflexota bacterium]MDE3267216.1 DUF6226 family protein [Chloroflexota bacterium]